MIRDIVAEGEKSGWRTHDASQPQRDVVAEADVVIISTGAGGGTSAEILSQAGLRVVLINTARSTAPT